MRPLILTCALCCAGCATAQPMSTTGSPPGYGPPGTLVAPSPVGGSAPLQTSPDPAGNLTRRTPPAGASPLQPSHLPPSVQFPDRIPTGSETLTLTKPHTPPAFQPQRQIADEPATLVTPRSPATAEPTRIEPIDSAPIIPDPNAALTPSTQQAGIPHQRTNAVEASKPAILTGWRAVSRSSNGHPIEMLQLGRGSRHLIVTGSLFGNERDAVEFVESLAELLQREPQRLGDYSIVLVKSPNPDGLTDGTITNGHGVELNRNFPSSHFLSQRTPETGLSAGSEPETQTLMHLCDDFRPDRVVHVRAGQGARVLLLTNARGKEGLLKRLDRNLMNAGEFDAYKAGSIEEYATDRLQTEMLLLWLPVEAGQWRNEIPRLATAIIEPTTNAYRPASRDGSDRPVVSELTTQDVKQDLPRESGPPDLFAPYHPPQPRSNAGLATAPRGKKGYVEILPPPPDQAEDEKGRDAKYYELTPPG
ncbi:MAG: M14 family zinc carboxypeptidase [Planctomycetaceae bacterium]